MLEYDFDDVMSFCRDGAQNGIHNLISDLNALVGELDDCQDTFHCKGGDSANACMKIYQGFSTLIGFSNGVDALSYSAGLASVATYGAQLVNTCYAEASEDKKKVEDISSMNWG